MAHLTIFVYRSDNLIHGTIRLRHVLVRELPMIIQRRLRRFILALSGLALACAFVSILAFVLRPPRFTSRIEAISYTLTQHGAHFEQVFIERGWPDEINSSVYTTSLRIYTREFGDIGGRYECRDGDTSCWVAVPKLNIDMVPVPDLARPVDDPLLTWLELHYAAVKAGKLPW